MQANDLLEYRNKNIDAFRERTFLSKHLKESVPVANDYVLDNVNNFIRKIESMSKIINLSLLEDFFGSSSQVDYAKGRINIENPDENKGIVAEIEYQI